MNSRSLYGGAARRNRCNSVDEMYAAIGYGGLQITVCCPN